MACVAIKNTETQETKLARKVLLLVRLKDLCAKDKFLWQKCGYFVEFEKDWRILAAKSGFGIFIAPLLKILQYWLDCRDKRAKRMRRKIAIAVANGRIGGRRDALLYDCATADTKTERLNYYYF